jgi:hypothetical protein
MGIRKAKEPMRPKEAIGPAIVVLTSTDPATLGPLAKNGSQATSNPCIYGGKSPPITVLIVYEPSSQSGIDLSYDNFQPVTIASFGL